MAKDITINLVGLKNFFGKMTKNLTWLFFAIFLILLVLEGFKIQNSTAIISGINEAPPLTVVERGIRFNFDNYKLALEKATQDANFVPTLDIQKNPFAQQVVAGPEETPVK